MTQLTFWDAAEPATAGKSRDSHAPQRANADIRVPTTELQVRARKPEPTEIFVTYWRFAVRRQELFFNKIRHPDAPPWTNDPILRHYKFTNAYRASDRVSQYLIRRVIYIDDDDLRTPQELFFRIILFKIFNKIATWEALEEAFGEVSWRSFDRHAYDRVLTDLHSRGMRIYSSAYIMAAGQTQFGHARKHRNHLCLLERMMHDRLPDRIAQAQPRLGEVYATLRAYPTIGPFLAYQYAVDLNYSPLLDASEDDFVMPGPGALDGLSKCFHHFGDYDPADVIQWVTDQQEAFFEENGLSFLELWGRRLTLIDCQNLFCEVDKYARVAHPDVRGRSNRTRIKQEYRPGGPPLQYWYPPKWGLNDRIARDPGYRGHVAPVCG